MLKIFEWLEMWPTSMTREVDTNYKVQTAMGKRWGADCICDIYSKPLRKIFVDLLWMGFTSIESLTAKERS